MPAETISHEPDANATDQMTASDFRELLIEVEVENYVLLLALAETPP